MADQPTPNGILSDHPFEIPEDVYLNQRRKIRVVCCGFGVSGIVAAYKIGAESNLGDGTIELQCYERTSTPGGTWLQWTYPGVACDIPAHIYAYNFAPNPDWSHFYVGGREILEYQKTVVDKFKLDQWCKYGHSIESADWDDKKGVWKFVIKNLATGEDITDEAEIFLNYSAKSTNIKLPNIAGIEDYEGKLMHNGQWDHSFDFTNKTAGLIGNGSGAVQLLPKLAPVCKKFTNFVRSPMWCTPGFGAKKTPNGSGLNFAYSEEDKKRFRDDPAYHNEYRRDIEKELHAAFPTYTLGGQMQKKAFDTMVALMRERLHHDERLCKALIPTWAVGCRRITAGTGYLETLHDPNVALVTSGIKHFVKDGIVTDDGEFHQLDSVICATGYDTSFSNYFPVSYLGKTLGEDWDKRNGPPCYFGRTYVGVPNYFVSLAPNGPLSHGSAIPGIEKAVEYALMCIGKIQREGIKSMIPKKEVYEQFQEYQKVWLQDKAWYSHCRSWFKSGTADAKPMLWPGTGLGYNQMSTYVRFEDFDYTYRTSNMFASIFGNGITLIERDGLDPTVGYMPVVADTIRMPPDFPLVWGNGVPEKEEEAPSVGI